MLLLFRYLICKIECAVLAIPILELRSFVFLFFKHSIDSVVSLFAENFGLESFGAWLVQRYEHRSLVERKMMTLK